MRIDETAGQSADGPRDGNGWHVLLGTGFAGRMICVESASSDLSGFFRQLGAVVLTIRLAPPSRSDRRPDSRLDEAARQLESAPLASEDEQGFFALVLHDLVGEVLLASESDALVRLLSAAYRMLTPGGVCYLGFRNAHALLNRCSYKRLLTGRLTVSPNAVRTAFSRAGFAPHLIRQHAFLLDEDRVLEVLPERGYTSVKDSTLWRERAKEWCFGRFGARHFAPGFGAVAHKEQEAPSFIEHLAGELKPLLGATAEPLTMLRCLIASDGKVFLSFGHESDRHGQLIAVCTRNKQSVARREREAETIAQLVARVPQLQNHLPEILGSASVGTHRFFALREFPGMTIDRPCPGDWVAMRNAADFISKLHFLTGRRTDGDDSVFARTVGSLFDQAIQRYPWMTETLESLRQTVRKRWTGREQLIVWMHGDYKLENVVVDPQSFSVLGVIDWELSCQDGLPVLDVLYLIGYSRYVRCGLSEEEMYRQVILAWRFTPDEQGLLDRYLRGVGMAIEDTKLLRAVFLIHDIGVRRLWRSTVPRSQEVLHGMISDTIALLRSDEAPSSRSAGAHLP